LGNVKVYLLCFFALGCSVANDTDDLNSLDLEQYTGVYEGFLAEYLADTLLKSDSSYTERIWMDDTGLFWSPILGEVDSLADDIKYSMRMRFNDDLRTYDTLEDKLFIFFVYSTLRDDSIIRNIDVWPKDSIEYSSRQYRFALRKK